MRTKSTASCAYGKSGEALESLLWMGCAGQEKPPLRVFSRRRQAALSYIWMTTICHSPGVQKTGEKYPFQRHEPIRTMRFQCRTEQYVSECIPPSEGLILEGTYSCHPILRDDYALRVFLEISGKTQRERILVREKENSSNFFQIWIPMEMNYFQSCEVKSHADLCLHTEWRNER